LSERYFSAWVKTFEILALAKDTKKFLTRKMGVKDLVRGPKSFFLIGSKIVFLSLRVKRNTNAQEKQEKIGFAMAEGKFFPT